MVTKYGRQILRAAQQIQRKGVQVVWAKASDTDTSNDTSPEFPSAEAAVLYTVWAVFYPQKAARYATIDGVQVLTGTTVTQMFCALPGNVPFTPEEGDAVKLPDGSILHVAAINTTQPDLVPIVYEVSFK